MTSSSGKKKTTKAVSRSSSTNTTPCCTKVGLNKGPWTEEEDEILANYIKSEGEGRWRTLPKRAGLLRCGKSCRLRWMNYLRPSVKRGHISPDEEDLILRLHRLLGNRWSLIAGRIPGRTDNEIKNYWNTHLSKKLVRQGIDPRTHKPLSDDAINANKNKPSSFNPTINHVTSSNSSPVSSGPHLGSLRDEQGTYMNDNPLGDDQDQFDHIHDERDSEDISNCNDEVFASFLNSLINEDPFASGQQHPTDDATANGASTNSSDIPMIIVSSGFGDNESQNK